MEQNLFFMIDCCVQKPVKISLSSHDTADEQCAYTMVNQSLYLLLPLVYIIIIVRVTCHVL